MDLTAEKIVLAAKQHQIGEFKNLAESSKFVGVVGLLVHNLQSERGASSIYLASAGVRFADIRLELAAESARVEQQLRRFFEQRLEQGAAGNARLVYLMAWVLLGLDELPELRRRISERKLSAEESLAAFSRLIAGLISLIFEVADAAIDPRISGLLVAFFNLVQAKELAGQERAVGALSFASGVCDGEHQQRVIHLLEAQERHFQVFGEFAEAAMTKQWEDMQEAPYMAQLERLRRILCTVKPGAPLDPDKSDKWFESCSARLTDIWLLQQKLVEHLQTRCAELIAEAEADLQDSEGLLRSLRENPPARAGLADRFFDPAIPVESALSFAPPVGSEPGQGQSIIDVLQAQTQRLASMETELASARRALEERKIIERAKGILMSRFKLSEEAAYKRLRTASMEQNMQMAEVAESVLAMAAHA